MPFRALADLRRHYADQAGRLVDEFYGPVLAEAIRYDRQAGYFDSGALVQVAAGLAGFIRQATAHDRRPAMRLITSASWTAADVDAYERGHAELAESLGSRLLGHFAPSDEECRRLGLPPGWRPEEDEIARHRLGALAWMVASGLLEVKIALPLDPDGRPYLPGRQGALFHVKSGVLWDAAGDSVAFQGSVNETGAAWTRNREKFDVRRSWYSPQDAEDIQVETREFDTLWHGRDPGLHVLSLPNAVRDKLISFAQPDGPPERDPLTDNRRLPPPLPTALLDRLTAHWLLEAPRRPGGESLALAPLTLLPFPHQTRVVEGVVGAYPQAFLLCDEVGLGKTIEAGLALRRLLLRGDVQRSLIIPPRRLARQWLQELREKFAITAWFYDGETLRDVAGRLRPAARPLEEDGVIVVSRQLIARADRRAMLLAARPWDVLIVDEAHAARRTVFGRHQPNQFLALLQELRRRNAYRCLWLLTATPMQLAPHEVHDLLLLCGLDAPSWQSWRQASAFDAYFQRLRQFAANRDVRPEVVAMARLAVAHGAPDLAAVQPPPGWNPFAWRSFVPRLREEAGRALALRNLSIVEANALVAELARQTPLAVSMFRHTRATLRAYAERGLVAQLARREPVDAAVSFQTAAERDLYVRIDDLCSHFYRLADLPPEERAGVGFLMAVFRKRLSSSFAAFRCSLERRLNTIELSLGRLNAAGLVREAENDDEPDDDEREAEDAGSAAIERLRERARLQRLAGDPRRRRLLERERDYLRDYVAALGALQGDSKYDVFAAALGQLLAEGQRVLVFTQYLDTLDFLRERLVARHADHLACYSGRGGEVWDGQRNAWKAADRAEIKARAARQHARPLTILLGTDAASEGLNLQGMTAIVNYDLPWNPMRVEQRIGRVDRIGQTAPVVKIVNLYVRDTIEEDTYRVLKTRIGLFEEVVGPLQPILAEMPHLLARVARGELELAEARRQLDELAQARPDSPLADLESFVRPDTPTTTRQPPSSATQTQLAAWCSAHPAPGMHLDSISEPGGAPDARTCYALTWPGVPSSLGITPDEVLIATFDAAVADRHPPTPPPEGTAGGRTIDEGARLLTWGDAYLTAWLEALRGRPPTEADYQAAGQSPDTPPPDLGMPSVAALQALLTGKK
jgi:superfamily II DNA or RNA helicase